MLTTTSLPSVFARRNMHYGWVVVGATFLPMFVTAGAVGAPGAFTVPLQKEFGWNTSDVSSAPAVRFLLYGLFGAFAAALINRFGVRWMVFTALSIVTSGLLLSLLMTQLWQLVVLWGVVVGIGTGLTAMLLGATVANRWFSQRR